MPAWRQVERKVEVWDLEDRNWLWCENVDSAVFSGGQLLRTMQFDSQPTKESCVIYYDNAYRAMVGIDRFLETVAGHLRTIPPRPVNGEWMRYTVRL